jgi:hypothetical protein
MPVVPPKPRYKVENRETSTRFIIPSRKNWRAIMFSIVILFPWTSVEFGFLKIFIKAVQGTVSGIESFWGSLTSLGLGWPGYSYGRLPVVLLLIHSFGI